MKLVDILAREMKVWPTSLEGCDSITQDDDGFMNATITGKTPSLFDGAWIYSGSRFFNHPNGRGDDYRTEVADDFATAIVTREQWQAAVDALNGPVWPAKGVLPPVGTKCIVTPQNNEFIKKFVGKEVEVVMHDTAMTGEPIAVFRWPDPEEMEESDGEDASYLYAGLIAGCFEPIRTAEQIAAAEREEAINELASSIGRGTFIQDATHIYDELGYRKQVAP